jgi:hypothetical protein
MLLRTKYMLRAAAVLSGVLLPGVASAVTCSSLGLPNPIYGSGGSAITNTLKAVATELAKLPENERVTIFWTDPGACSGYQAFLDKNVKTKFKFWDANGVEDPNGCTADDVVAGQEVDFAHMGNTPDYCIDGTQPADVIDTPGSIQTVNLITGVDSVEDSISAEAVYLAFGFGATSEAGPWTVEAGLQLRTSTSFVHLFVANAVGLPPTAFKGVKPEWKTNDEVAKAVGDFANADASLGYVSSSAAEKAKETVKTLAYQHFDQTCGVYPDSTATRFDKQNVRNGKYYFWTPGHWYARGANGAITNEKAAKLISWLTAKAPAPGNIDVNAKIIGAGDIPECAMQVQREGTDGAISSFAPAKPCGCYFESLALKEVPDYCSACETDADCGGGDTPSCNFGFCESYRAEGEVEG